MPNDELTQRGWRQLKLADLGIVVGGGTPSRAVKGYFTGNIPWVTVKDIEEGHFSISDASEHITAEAIEKSATNLIEPNSVIVATRVGLGKVATNQRPIAINQDLKAILPSTKVLPEFLVFLLYKSVFEILKFSTGTTVKGIRQNDLLEIPVLLPPIPVQERIVQILRKADEIRRKREEAVLAAEAILSASFISMFGEPGGVKGNFELVPLGEIADVKSGVTKGKKFNGKTTIEVPYLRVANVQDGFLDISEVKTIKVLPKDIIKYRLEDGDILMTEGGDPDKLGRGCVWRNQIEGCIHQNHIFRVRTDRGRLTPEYLAGLLRTHYAKQYFLSCAKRSSNLASVNSTQVKAFSVPVPPLDLQKKFVSAVEHWIQTSERLNGVSREANKLFESLIHSAIDGELTVEWEAANPEWIATQIELRERLPRLVLLFFLQEKAARAGRAGQAAILVTALMKYAFLLQMEGSVRRRFYHFVPYHYGPFAKELYADLERLQDEGLVAVDNHTDEDKTRITLTDLSKAEAALSELPEDLKEEVAIILDDYGDLDHNALLKTVYDKYPAYAKRSRLRNSKRA